MIYYYEVLNEEKNWSKTEILPETDLINLEAATLYKIRVRVVSTTYQSSVWTDELEFITADETISTLSAVDKLREDMVRLGGMRGTVASVLFEEFLKKNVCFLGFKNVPQSGNFFRASIFKILMSALLVGYLAWVFLQRFSTQLE